jgi:superfamily II DNA or RNA helicase
MITATWPHQAKAHDEITAAIDAGEQALCVTSPTGGGKTKIMSDLIWWARERKKRVILYTNRRMLLEQLQRVMATEGFNFGVRASGHKLDTFSAVQVSSIQTEASRVYRQQAWQLFDANLVIIDEAHVNAADFAERIVRDHKAAGAAVVGFTATPIDLAHLYSRLIVAGTNSELRRCGAHVICHTYGPDEPDAKNLPAKVKIGEDLSENQIRKAIMAPNIFARVLEAFEELNPDHKPTILFAPGVRESIWFAEQFRAAGITAAHIDGDEISYGALDEEGQSVTVKSNRERRAEILEGSKAGHISVLCNRFVLREGIDAPWLSHAIFATIFGSLGSYLQAGGRLLRSFPGLEYVTVQDHGGNWWRHGSLNADRQWDLTWGSHVYSGVREARMREKKDPEPIRCPKCARIRASGAKCPHCGYTASKQSRVVVQTDGTLREMTGDIFKPRRVARRHNTQQLWEQMYYRAKSKKWDATFAQAEALFFYENHYYAPRDLSLMPRSDADFYLKVRDVPRESLRQSGEETSQRTLHESHR